MPRDVILYMARKYSNVSQTIIMGRMKLTLFLLLILMLEISCVLATGKRKWKTKKRVHETWSEEVKQNGKTKFSGRSHADFSSSQKGSGEFLGGVVSVIQKKSFDQSMRDGLSAIRKKGFGQPLGEGLTMIGKKGIFRDGLANSQKGIFRQGFSSSQKGNSRQGSFSSGKSAFRQESTSLDKGISRQDSYDSGKGASGQESANLEKGFSRQDSISLDKGISRQDSYDSGKGASRQESTSLGKGFSRQDSINMDKGISRQDSYGSGKGASGQESANLEKGFSRQESISLDKGISRQDSFGSGKGTSRQESTILEKGISRQDSFGSGKGSSRKDFSSSKKDKCFYNGEFYNYGEEIPTREKCLSCICSEEFDENDMSSSCARMECPYDHFRYLYSFCIPLYEKDECCPVRWDCGEGLTKIENRCQCESKYLRHYEAKNCTPVYEIDGCACPTRFECPPPTEMDPAVCRYQGIVYEVGSEIDTGTPCERCRCHRPVGQDTATFDCLSIECSAAFNTPIQEGCYRSHNLSYCCSVDTICPSNDEQPIQCKYNGKLYNLGQKIYPEEEPCVTCLCTKDWSGIYSKNCVRNQCFMGQYGNLERGCIPIYHEDTCCHVEFHCPDQRDTTTAVQKASVDRGIPERCVLPMEKGPCYAKFTHYYYNVMKRKCESFIYGGCLGNENNFLTHEECQSTCESKLLQTNTNLDHMCYFDGHYYSIGEEYGINHPTGCVTCTCNVPPDLTCVHKSCPPPPHEYGDCKGAYTPGVCCPEYNCTTKAGEVISLSSKLEESKSCGTPSCPPGCDVVQDVPLGICPGCRCHTFTTDTSTFLTNATEENCAKFTCPSPFCVTYRSADGCPRCVCNLLCPIPSCSPGCTLQDIVPGQCPECICVEKRIDSASDRNITDKQSNLRGGYSSAPYGLQIEFSSKRSGLRRESTYGQSNTQNESSATQFGSQQNSLSEQSGLRRESQAKTSGFQKGSLSEQSGFQKESSSEQSGFQKKSSSTQLGSQQNSLPEQSGLKWESQEIIRFSKQCLPPSCDAPCKLRNSKNFYGCPTCECPDGNKPPCPVVDCRPPCEIEMSCEGDCPACICPSI